jgi:hypothetical protein
MRRLALLALGSALAGFGYASPTCWELNANLTIDLVNVANNNETLFNTTPFASKSLARKPSGVLLSADNAGNLWNVTGPPIPVGSIGKQQIGDLDYGVGGLWGFSNFSKELFFYDLTTLTVTYSQAFSLPSTAEVTGVAYQPSTGDVYLSAFTSLNNDFLLHVPAFSSTMTNIGPMNNGDAFSYFSDIDFDTSGNLVGMTFFHRYFYDINTSNAATSLLSVGPHRDTTAFALDPVPEPASLIVFGAGAVGLLRRRRAQS